MAGISSADSSTHIDTQPANIAAFEKKVVTKLKESITNFMNPIATDNRDVMFCLSSGAPAPEKIENGLFDAYRNRLEALKNVWLIKSFEEAKLKTFADTKKVKKVNQSRRNNLVKVKAAGNVFGQLIMLSLSCYQKKMTLSLKRH
jgi:hypothetical protein